MTTPDPSSEEAPATLTTLARTLLVISIGLAGWMVGYGYGEYMDPDGSWVQLAAPVLLSLILVYVLAEDIYRRES